MSRWCFDKPIYVCYDELYQLFIIDEIKNNNCIKDEKVIFTLEDVFKCVQELTMTGKYNFNQIMYILHQIREYVNEEYLFDFDDSVDDYKYNVHKFFLGYIGYLYSSDLVNEINERVDGNE